MPSSQKLLRIISISILCFILSSCHVGRYFWWNYADIHDMNRFPAVPVQRGNAVFSFHQAAHPVEIPIRQHNRSMEEFPSFEAMLEQEQTASFLILRNDTIVYEYYGTDFDSSSVLPSFSVSKVFLSALTGIAIAEGKIKSTAQTIGTFLPELNDSGVKQIRILDLLNMRAGLDFTESYGNPFALMPKFYYGRNLEKYARNLHLKQSPGKVYEYQSAASFLLGLLLERASGKPLNQYLEEKIWQPLGMESDASWNTDSRKYNTIKSFCCLNARTRDFARFGRLYLNKGNWNGRQIVPAGWVETSMRILNDSRDSQNYPYTYQWRVCHEQAIFAKGVLGQYIYVYPGKNIVIVRFGKKAGSMHWPALFKTIVTSDWI